jgi:membrane protease YdiL (CAAX protease family)
VVYFILLAGERAMLQQAAYAGGKLIQFLFPAFWCLRVQRERWMWQLPRRAEVVFAGGVGLALLGAALALYHFHLKPAGFFGDAVIDAIHSKVQGIGVGTIPRYVALTFFYSLIHSLLEEYYWRWFVFGQLRRLLSLPSAIAISSAGFMAHHICIISSFFGWFSPASLLLALAVGAGGAIWAWLYHRTGSLWGPWISHALVDAAIFIIGYDLAL